jgi:alkylation response protein AidB-like acyl-CoA dehydrogenase
MQDLETEERVLLRTSIRKFLDREMPRSLARELDRKADYSREAFGRLCRDLGVTALMAPEEYGGAGVDIVSAIIVIEELARRGTSLAGPFIHCAFYGAMNILENGSKHQKETLLPLLARGELLFAYGLSEPDVGGDLASAAVTAKLSDDGQRVTINGVKRWCTGARIADYIYTLVRSGPADAKYKNLSLVLTPTRCERPEHRRHRPSRIAL